MQTSPTFLSLFSGCGGFDLGFLSAGFRCIGAFDIDRTAHQVYCANLGNHHRLQDLSNGLRRSDISGKVDVILAGPPCQGFSLVGKRDVKDPRNKLLLTPATLAGVFRPKVVIVENVTGVTAGQHRIYWDELNQKLKSFGYRTAEIKCNALDHGVPQIRRRVLLFAWRASKDINVELPTSKAGTLQDVLGHLDSVHNHEPRFLSPASNAAKIAKRIKPGQKLSNVRAGERSVHTWDIPDVFGKTTSTEKKVLEAILRLRRRNRLRTFGDADPVTERSISRELGFNVADDLLRLIQKGFVRKRIRRYDLAHTFNGTYRRLLLSEPAPTVDTKFGESRFYLHPIEERGYTVREASRLQGFPDTFIFAGPLAHQYRLIGNAVPPPLAASIARFTRTAFFT